MIYQRFLTNLLLIVLNKYGASSIIPPRLNVAEDSIDIPPDTPFTLECKGEYDIIWTHPEHVEEDIELKEKINVSSRIVNGTKFLSLSFPPSYMYTGLYMCYYDGTTDVSARRNASSVYLFFNDPQHLFLPPSIFNSAITIQRKISLYVRIPCIPTNSKINVTLWEYTAVGKMRSLVENPSIKFEPQKGVLVQEPYPNLICKGFIFLDKYTEDLLYFNITDTKRGILKPTFWLTPTTWSKGESRNITCLVPLLNSNSVEVSWICPDNSICKNDSFQTDPDDKEVTSVLSIYNTDTSDEGLYICSVIISDLNGVWNISNQIYITVFERNETEPVNITTDLESPFSFTRKIGSSIEFSANITNYTFDDIDFHWEKDGLLIQNNSKYKFTLLSSRTVLNVENLQVTDSGIYTIIGRRVRYEYMSKISFHLAVRNTLSPPRLNIASDYVDIYPGNGVTLECNGENDVMWNFPDHVKLSAKLMLSARENKGNKSISLRLPPSYFYTGRYTCSYNSTTDFTSRRNSTSVYLYFNDENNFFLPQSTVTSYVIHPHTWFHPCFPTESKLEVKLCRKISDSELIEELEDDVAEFEDTKGFSIKKLFSGSFCCEGKNLEGLTKYSSTFNVAEGDEVMKPHIEIEPTVFITGEDATLNCYFVYQHEERFKVTIRWSGPNNLKDRYNNAKQSPIQPKSALELKKINHADEGNYTCFAIIDNHINDTYFSKPIYISVFEKDEMEPVNFIKDDVELANFIKDSEGRIYKNSGESVEFSVNISNYKSEDVDLHWEKDGYLIQNDKKYKIVSKLSKVTLRIKNLDDSDSGTYNIFGRKIKRDKDVSFQLIVKKEGEISDTFKSVVAIIIVAALISSVLALSYRIKKAMRHSREMRKQKSVRVNPEIPFEEQIDCLPYDTKWEFPKNRLKFGQAIGFGAFGKVLKADALGLNPNVPYTTVAVKTLKDTGNVIQMKALFDELKIMIHLGNHTNVLNLLGAVTKRMKKGELMVISEYCCFGNLRSHLIKLRKKFINQIDPESGKISSSIFIPNTGVNSTSNRRQSECDTTIGTNNEQIDTGGVSTCTSNTETTLTSAGTSNEGNNKNNRIKVSSSKALTIETLTTSDLLSYCFQISQGMRYLESKKFVHRDLAARNILLAEGNVIKIADFGLAKDIYKDSNYIKKSFIPLPMKWMALESLQDSIFTTMTDVWSFGILSWEIFTLGRNPYPGLDINEHFVEKLKDGYRMSKPDFATEDIYKMMLDCWKPNPEDRPTFHELAKQFGLMMEENQGDEYVEVFKRDKNSENQNSETQENASPKCNTPSYSS